MRPTLQKLVIVLVVGVSASAAARFADAATVIATATKVKDPAAGMAFLAPEGALPAPWVSYQLSLSTTGPSDFIGAVEVVVTGNKLHQRWIATDFDGVIDPSPTGPASDGRGDSHLTPPAGSPFGFGPTETNTKAGSPLTGSPQLTEYGVGNLSGAWGLLIPAQTTNIAYLVFKSTDAPDITIKAVSPTGQPYDVISVPEPTALALCAMVFVCLGFIRRR